MTPKEVLIQTTSDTKAPKSCGPFQQGGLKCIRKMRVLLNYEHDEKLVARMGKDYFKTAPWMVPIVGTPYVTNVERTQTYLRFLVLEVLEETFVHNNETVPTPLALKYLPKRTKSSNPVYLTMKTEGIKFQ